MTRYRSSRNLGQIANLTVQKRWDHEHRSAASHFLKLASGGRRQLSEQAVIPRTEPYNLDRSTLADFTGLIPTWKPESTPGSRPTAHNFRKQRVAVCKGR